MQRFLLNALGNEYSGFQRRSRRVYEQDKTATVRNIFIGTVGRTEEEKREIYTRMEEILVRARNGEDFSALAESIQKIPPQKRKAVCMKTSNAAK